MPATYDCIASVTLTGNETTITFSNIPGTYTDLVLIYNGMGNDNAAVRYYYNSDSSTSSYSYVEMGGNGSAATSGYTTRSTGYRPYMITNGSGTTPSTAILNIMNYSNTTTLKTAISKGADANYRVSAVASLWNSTAAITAVNITDDTFTSGTSVALYGIKAA